MFAGAVVSLREVMAVLGAVAVMMAIGTLILLWTVKEGPAAVSQGANTFTHTFETRLEVKNINFDLVKNNLVHSNKDLPTSNNA